METNENYQLSQGAGLTIEVTLRDSNGAVITSFDGSQSLTTTVWPGGNRFASFTATTTWTTPAEGVFTIAIMDEQTTGLAPGRYQLLTRLSDAGALVDAYGCTLDILASAGSESAPRTY